MSNNYIRVLVSDIQIMDDRTGIFEDGCFVDGHNVDSHLYKFATTLRKSPAFRQVKFGRTLGDYRTVLQVYFPNELYAMGDIGYADYNLGENSDIRMSYKVASRFITNRKYKHRGNATYWALSQNLQRAVSNAKRYLRPYAPHEILQDSARILASHIRTELGELIDTVADKRREVCMGVDTDGGDVLRELITMRRKGVIENERVGEKIDAYVQALDLRKAENKRVFDVFAVFTVKSLRGDVAYTVAQGPVNGVELGKFSSSTLMEAFQNQEYIRCHTQTYSGEELPPELASRLAVLAMVDDGTYVHGVGLKFRDEIMYVLQERE